MPKLLFATLFAFAVACGNPDRDTLRRNAEFDCHDRVADYTVTGSLAGAEVGTQIDCAERGPRIIHWTVDKDGNRDEYQGSLTVGEFDQLWTRIDATGWQNLKDCDGTGQPSDPVYTFDVKDWNGSASFACTNSGELPYPYNTIVDELDMESAKAQPVDKHKPTKEELN